MTKVPLGEFLSKPSFYGGLPLLHPTLKLLTVAGIIIRVDKKYEDISCHNDIN